VAVTVHGNTSTEPSTRGPAVAGPAMGAADAKAPDLATGPGSETAAAAACSCGIVAGAGGGCTVVGADGRDVGSAPGVGGDTSAAGSPDSSVAGASAAVSTAGSCKSEARSCSWHACKQGLTERGHSSDGHHL